MDNQQSIIGGICSSSCNVIAINLGNLNDQQCHNVSAGISGYNASDCDVVDASAENDNALGLEVDLIGVICKSEDEAYEIYNDYAFRIGFSIRKDKSRHRVDKTLEMRQFVCSKAGLKRKNSDVGSSYSRLEVRCNCAAMLKFDVHKDGIWVVTKHVVEHNHELCPPTSSYRLKSHRRITVNQLRYLEELQKSGVRVVDSVRVLKNQSGGSPFVGFSVKDAYNVLSRAKILDGTDSNTLIHIFKNRQTNEKDFYFEFEVDHDARLCSFFWRDGRMKQDYELFGDLLVHDTTYRTNRYDMICAPFVGMNHHGMNIMFGCGFLLNERTESFEWLFSAFLRSMGLKHPITIMTYQSAPMALAISKIFPLSRHRLCLWHIGENSKKHINSLRCQNGFMDLFNKVLKFCDTIAEFDYYWKMMLSTYHCQSNKWLCKLYEIREKWCPTFNKQWFSGGVLSSQRSESTNHSISRRLTKTAGLCDFYHSFVDVISEWRSKENGQDIRCSQGKPSIALADSKLLLHARDIYTNEVYYIFEEQFLKGAQCHQLFIKGDVCLMTYHVWVEGVDIIRHEIVFGTTDKSISCTCKYFEEVGVLCCHCLRILNIHCVCSIPESYIKKRWCKSIVMERVLEDDLFPGYPSVSNFLAAPLWRIQMTMKFYKLITASEDNSAARFKCEEAFRNVSHSIIEEVGPIYYGESVDCASSSSSVIQDPQGTSLKYKRNRRPKSIIEKKFKQAEEKRKRTKNLKDGQDLYIVHPSSGTGPLQVISPNTSSGFVPLNIG